MAKRVEAEFQLPEAIIQHIQSFLCGKEAAKTTILAKSWYSAWLTRPNVDFDQRDFPYRGGDDKVFFDLVMKTLQRYQDLNLKIEGFKLWMRGYERDGHSLANELIVRAIKMGVNDLSFEIFPVTLTFALPREVVGSETLIRLSVTGCKIEDVKVNCSKLKSLILREVYLEGDKIWDLLSCCPLIEELVLSECKYFTKVQNLPYCSNVTTKKRMLALSPLSELERHNVGLGVGGPINLFELHKLKCLFLEKVKISTLFFADFSSKFPCLKKLTVRYCFGYKEIQIYSHSLESISFEQKVILKANFYVPRIRKFKFSGSSLLPCLSFETAYEEWESDILITCKTPSASWFFNLNKLLTNLSLSRIYLTLYFQCEERSFDHTGEIEVLPVVETLTLRASPSVFSALLDGIFWSCRPMWIIQQWFPKSCTGLAERANNHLLALLCMTLTQEVIGDSPYLYDLKEVSLFEESRAEWRPLLWTTLLEAFTEIERTICFRLTWGLEASTFG